MRKKGKPIFTDVVNIPVEEVNVVISYLCKNCDYIAIVGQNLGELLLEKKIQEPEPCIICGKSDYEINIAASFVHSEARFVERDKV